MSPLNVQGHTWWWTAFGTWRSVEPSGISDTRCELGRGGSDCRGGGVDRATGVVPRYEGKSLIFLGWRRKIRDFTDVWEAKMW